VALYTVIGARGFIGARLAQALAADGHEVQTPARGGPLDGPLGRVMYCAGLTGDYRTRPFDTVEAHVSLLSRVLAEGDFERLVYLSSTRLYQTTGAAVAREDQPLRLDPNDPEQVYELSKALGENLAVNRSGGRGAAARLSYVFDWSPGAAGFLSDWLVRARDARDLDVASTSGDSRDYIHLDDVVRALRALADSDVNAVVNVAAGRGTRNAEVAQVFADAGRRVTFTGTAAPAAMADVDVSRLAALGVTARPATELIAGYLAGL
jgi:nucleoside-diphosphate-sugar epimerase